MDIMRERKCGWVHARVVSGKMVILRRNVITMRSNNGTGVTGPAARIAVLHLLYDMLPRNNRGYSCSKPVSVQYMDSCTHTQTDLLPFRYPMLSQL